MLQEIQVGSGGGGGSEFPRIDSINISHKTNSSTNTITVTSDGDTETYTYSGSKYGSGTNTHRVFMIGDIISTIAPHDGPKWSVTINYLDGTSVTKEVNLEAANSSYAYNKTIDF